MSDTPARLVRLAQQLEDQHAPQHMTILMREAAKEMEGLRAYALKAFTVVEFCSGEGFLLQRPYYDCDDLLMEGVDLLKVETPEEARAALGEKE